MTFVVQREVGEGGGPPGRGVQQWGRPAVGHRGHEEEQDHEGARYQVAYPSVGLSESFVSESLLLTHLWQGCLPGLEPVGGDQRLQGRTAPA